MEENEKTRSIEKEIMLKLKEFDKKIHEFIIKPVLNRLPYTYTSDGSYIKIEDIRLKLDNYIVYHTRTGFDIKIIGELENFLKVELPDALRSIEKIVYSSFPIGQDRSLVKMNIAARFDDIKEIILTVQELKEIKYPYEARREKSYQESVYDMLTKGGIVGDNKETLAKALKAELGRRGLDINENAINEVLDDYLEVMRNQEKEKKEKGKTSEPEIAREKINNFLDEYFVYDFPDLKNIDDMTLLKRLEFSIIEYLERKRGRDWLDRTIEVLYLDFDKEKYRKWRKERIEIRDEATFLKLSKHYDTVSISWVKIFETYIVELLSKTKELLTYATEFTIIYKRKYKPEKSITRDIDLNRSIALKIKRLKPLKDFNHIRRGDAVEIFHELKDVIKSWKEKSHYIANRASKSDSKGHIAEYFINYIKAMEHEFRMCNNKIHEKQEQAKNAYKKNQT